MPISLYLLRVTPFENESVFIKAYRRIDEDRQRRVDRYAKDEDKYLALGAGLLIRYIRKKFGIEEEVCYNEWGKAYFPSSKVYFNLSHSGEYVALAVSNEEVGVDIEAHDEIAERILPKVFTPKEIEDYRITPMTMKKDLFYSLWTEKESFLKFIGVGLSKPLSSVDFSSFALQTDFVYPREGKEIHFHRYSFLKDYSLCLASSSGEAPEVKVLELEDVMDAYLSVNGSPYRLVKLLGKGKGGHSFLVEKEGRTYVLKAIHHLPCEYYAFGDKLASEKADYVFLRGIGINVPHLYEIDEEKERIVKEFVPGVTIAEEITLGHDISEARAILESWLPNLYQNKTNIDYYPTNFIYSNGNLYYIDYEKNDYMEQWDYEHWGKEYWK